MPYWIEFLTKERKKKKKKKLKKKRKKEREKKKRTYKKLFQQKFYKEIKEKNRKITFPFKNNQKKRKETQLIRLTHNNDRKMKEM